MFSVFFCERALTTLINYDILYVKMKSRSEKSMYHIASCSFGKDSLAMIFTAD